MTRLLTIWTKAALTITIFLVNMGIPEVSAAPGAARFFNLRVVDDIVLHGGTTRFDYQSYDEQRRLLFIAHLGDSTVTVFNTKTQKTVADIPNVSRVHGVLAIPELGRLYASATGREQVVAIDEDTLRTVATIPVGHYPDGMAYVPTVHKLYVSDEDGGTETVIDVHTNRRVATIPLGGEAGNTQYDPVSGHVFVNVQTRNELVEIDPADDHIVAHYPLPGADRNHGLLIVPGARLAFIACEDNAKLLIFDMRTMRVVASDSVGESPDVLAFDPTYSLIYVASESGVVSVFNLANGVLHKAWEERVTRHAHSIAVDSRTHRVYLPLQDVAGRPTLRIMQPTTGH
ncbi:MAG: YncE family protein [Sulfuricaulis sp.]